MLMDRAEAVREAQEILALGNPLFPQAEKDEDSVPKNNGELVVRAKLVFPAGPGKLQEAQEGGWPPAPQTFVCHCPQSLGSFPAFPPIAPDPTSSNNSHPTREAQPGRRVLWKPRLGRERNDQSQAAVPALRAPRTPAPRLSSQGAGLPGLPGPTVPLGPPSQTDHLRDGRELVPNSRFRRLQGSE